MECRSLTLTIFLTVLGVISVILGSHPCTLSSNVFAIEPSNKLAVKGDFVNLTCGVHGFDPVSEFISWEVSPDIGNTHSNEKYYEHSRHAVSIITAQANLSVQYFTCQRIYSKLNLCFSSRRATLKVNFHWVFPRENELKCGPSNPVSVRDGDLLQPFCNVPRGYPQVDMTWRLQPYVPGMNLPTHRDEAFHRVLTHTMTISRELHMKMIVCEVTSEIIFPGRLLQCVIGPILVSTSLTVLVHPSNAEMSYGQTTQFTCETNAYPSQLVFTWSCSPTGFYTGCESNSKTADISLITHFDFPDENFGLIECHVFNGVDQVSGFSHVELIPTSNTSRMRNHSRNQICPTDVVLNVTIESWNGSRPGSEMKVSCTIPYNIVGQDIELNWHVGDNGVLQNDQYVQIKQISRHVSHLYLSDLPHHFSKSISCVVVICNVRFEGFLNLQDNRSDILREGGENLWNMIGGSNTSYPRSQYYTTQPNAPTTYSILTDTSVQQTSQPYTSKFPKSHDKSTKGGHTQVTQIIPLALLCSFGIVIIVLSTIVATAVAIYKRLKKVNLKNINSIRKELKTNYNASMNQLTSNIDHPYEVPKTLPPITLSNDIFLAENSDNSQIYSSDDYCSSCSGSVGSSLSIPSGIYLEPDHDVVASKNNLSNGGDIHVVYGNDRLVQVKRSREFSNSPRPFPSTTMHHISMEISEVQMPQYPPNSTRIYEAI